MQDVLRNRQRSSARRSYAHLPYARGASAVPTELLTAWALTVQRSSLKRELVGRGFPTSYRVHHVSVRQGRFTATIWQRSSEGLFSLVTMYASPFPNWAFAERNRIAGARKSSGSQKPSGDLAAGGSCGAGGPGSASRSCRAIGSRECGGRRVGWAIETSGQRDAVQVAVDGGARENVDRRGGPRRDHLINDLHAGKAFNILWRVDAGRREWREVPPVRYGQD